MTDNQIIMLSIIVIYLIVNVIVGMVYSKRKDSLSDMSFSKKYFIGSRGMNGIVLAMTTVATYASVSSFVSGPGAAAMTYGFSQAWVAGVQVGAAFLVLGILAKNLRWFQERQERLLLRDISKPDINQMRWSSSRLC